MGKRKALLCVTVCLLILSALTACQSSPTAVAPEVITLDEHPVTQIELSGPVTSSQTEVSGMAWCGDTLILLPQFPDQFKEDGLGRVFAISKVAISEYLNSESPAAIEPDQIIFDTAGLPQALSGFEGFEAITFNQDVVYVTVETRQSGGMMGYLFSGTVSEDCSAITLDLASLQELPPQASLSNMSDETIILDGDRIYTVYEANGINVNPDPAAHVFDLDLTPLGTVSFPSIEYRVTDATTVEADGSFWVINYFYPGDTKLKPGDDQLTLTYGLGLSHQSAEQVERLVKMSVLSGEIEILDQAPIYLVLDSEESFNWEGLVRMGEGFLMITDEYPTTILGYVAGVNE